MDRFKFERVHRVVELSYFQIQHISNPDFFSSLCPGSYYHIVLTCQYTLLTVLTFFSWQSQTFLCPQLRWFSPPDVVFTVVIQALLYLIHAHRLQARQIAWWCLHIWSMFVFAPLTFSPLENHWSSRRTWRWWACPLYGRLCEFNVLTQPSILS